MKRSIIFLTLIIFSIQLIQAGGVGITPVYYKEFFEPGLVKEYIFNAFSTNSEEGVDIYIEGDLAEYVNLSTTYLPDGGEFVVTIALPNIIRVPGTHKILVGVIEAREGEEGVVGGRAAIQGRIDVLVPYPGRYTESTFKISDINKGEEAQYELEINNLGTLPLNISSKIEIFREGSDEPLLIERVSDIETEPKETLTLAGTLPTQELPPGIYTAYATVDWGEKTVLNQTFRVGEFLVDIIDYDYQFKQGSINPFRIEMENKWNTKIDEVFATVSITDEGLLVTNFKTISIDTDPWERKNITGYFDTSEFEAKRYTAKIVLSYDGATTSKLVAIYINEPTVKTYRAYIIAASIVALLIIIAFIYLVWKVRTLSKKNGKKK